MGNIRWTTVDDRQEAARHIGDSITKLLSDRGDKNALLLVSGGSALCVLDHILLGNGSGITIGALDERFDPDNRDSNFAALEMTDWFRSAVRRSIAVIDTKSRAGDTRETLRDRFQNALTEWADANPDGLTVAIFGMGGDGHTAGIFPYPEDPDFFEKTFRINGWVASYDATGKNVFRERVTTTFPFHETIDHAFAYVCGAEKRETLIALKNRSQALSEMPAMIFYDMPDIEVVTDQSFSELSL